MTPAEKLMVFGLVAVWAGFLVLVLGLARAAARADHELEQLYEEYLERDTSRPK